jgi:GT2 family glycosyltransferase
VRAVESIRHVAGADAPPAKPYDADIIILALDRTDDTLAAIASACTQSGASTHVFVLDQGSSPEGLERLARAIDGRPGTTLLSAERNLGVAAGRNVLSDRGHGRVIVALDNDAVFAAADTVARLVAALDAEPGLAAVGCRIIVHADGRDDLSSWGYPASLLHCAAECFDTVTFVGAGNAIRRAARDQAGGYDETLFFCWEEFDFCLRAIALGWRVRYRGDIVVRHKVAPEQRVGWSASRWFYFVRNRLYIERKLGRPWPALLPRAAAYLLKGLLHGRPLQTLRAIIASGSMAARPHGPLLPRPARSYLARNDAAHRGSLLRRFRRELLGPIGPARPAAPAAGR